MSWNAAVEIAFWENFPNVSISITGTASILQVALQFEILLHISCCLERHYFIN